jgi:Arc/MetJ-type ribon-helix-helix transcriptional regulator
MRQSVSISLPKDMLNQLRFECKREHANGSEIIRRSLRAYFFQSTFDRLRRVAQIEATKRGVQVSEEDIFDQIS